MGLHRWLGAILVSAVLIVGCGKPPQPGSTTGTTASTGSTAATTAPATTAPPSTPEPVATAAASATPAAGATAAPTAAATGTPAASASGAEGDFANAEGMAGYEEVKGLTPPPSTPEMVALGKEVYAGAGNCVSCHGADGKGDGPAGAALDPAPRNLHAAAEYKYGAGDHGVFRTIKYGVEGTGMAPLEGLLTDEQIWQVTAYVRSVQAQ